MCLANAGRPCVKWRWWRVAAGGDDTAAQFHEVTRAASFFFSRAADGVKTLVEKRRNVRLGLRPSAAPPSRGAGGARASRCPLLPAWRDITKQPRRRRSCSCCLAIAEARALPQQTKLASRLSQPSVNSPRAREWNMATGSGTGQQRASFSTSCLPVTWFNIKRLFYSNWPRRLFLLAVKCSPALVSRRLMFFFCLIFFFFFFFFLSQAYSDEDQGHRSHQTIMQIHWTFWICVQRQIFL